LLLPFLLPKPSFSTPETYSANTWYEIKFVINISAGTYDVYINDDDTAVQTGISFWGSASSLNCFTINRLDSEWPIEGVVKNMRVREIVNPEPSYGDWVTL
jgi:hypothetical protein